LERVAGYAAFFLRRNVQVETHRHRAGGCWNSDVLEQSIRVFGVVSAEPGLAMAGVSMLACGTVQNTGSRRPSGAAIFETGISQQRGRRQWRRGAKFDVQDGMNFNDIRSAAGLVVRKIEEADADDGNWYGARIVPIVDYIRELPLEFCADIVE